MASRTIKQWSMAAVIIKILILAFLIRILIATEKPFLCAGIYAAVAFLFGLFFSGGQVVAALISAGISFLLASVYFALLNALDTGSVLWWIVGLGGLAIGLV